MPIRLITAALFIFALQVTIHAQNSNGTIQGVVRDSGGAPLSDAQVRVVGDGVVVTADAGPDGTYILTDVLPGDYRVQVVDSLGRILSTTRVRLAPGGITQTVNFSIRTGDAGLSGAPAEPARFYVGGVGITPALTLWNLGSDTNVFNRTDAATRDTTFTLTPQAAITLDTARARGDGTALVDYQYFDKSSFERGVNGAFGGGLEIHLGRFTPWIDGGIDAGRRRINHEIDLRARHLTSDARVGIDTRVTSGTVGSVSVGRSEIGFDPNEFFLGSNLQELLNQRAESVRFEVRQDLTPTIAVVGRGTAMRERFRFAPQRDADVGSFEGGINTASRIATGSARIGYLRLERLHQGIANYRGLVVLVDELFWLGARSRLQVQGARDIAFSVDAAFPYYIQTGAIADLLAVLSDTWDVDVRASGGRMRHEPVPGVGGTRYSDTYGLVGADLGVRVIPDLRIGFGFAREERDSPRHERNFIGYRFGGSVTVGAPPIVRNRYRG